MKKYRTSMSHTDEEIELVKKLLKSLFAIVIVLVLTLGTLELYGPKIFSAFGLLSLDRFKKKEEVKFQTQTPLVVDIPKALKEKTITINGFSEPDSIVKLFLNGPEVASTNSDSEGKFAFSNTPLSEGQNIVFVKAQAPNKTDSEKSQTYYFYFDNKKPAISIEKPKNDEEFESVDSRVPVKGKVNEKASVSVNEHITVVDSEGSFQTLVSVKEGENKIFVLAVDEAGNEASASVKIKFKKR